MPLVGLGRFELPTSRLSGVRSNQLSYRPMCSFAGHFCRKKEPHYSSVRSVETVDAPEGRAASVANKTLPAIYFAILKDLLNPLLGFDI